MNWLDAARVFLRVIPARLRPLIAYRLATLGAEGYRHVRVNRVVMNLDLSDWVQRLYYLGQADQDRIDLLRSLLPREAVVVDAGAYIGLYTCALAGCVAKVWAFEPDPRSVARLQRNIALNGFTNVITRQVALMESEGQVAMFLPPGSPESPATRTKNPGGWDSAGLVEARRLDDVFSGIRLDLIKIDVEGAELSVLNGALALIDKHRPIIFCEVHADSRRGIERFASDFGYDLPAWESVIQDVLLVPH